MEGGCHVITGISSLDHDTDKVNALLAEVADGYGTANRHVSGGALNEALDVLPAQIRLLAEPMDAELLARGEL